MVSALELMSKNIFCGSVRIVYAIIYTLFLVRSLTLSFSSVANICFQGFGLTIGSDFFLVLDSRARRNYYRSSIPTNLNYTRGYFLLSNGSHPGLATPGVLGVGHAGTNLPAHTVKSEFKKI